ncbi:MAG TPA: pyruvate, phosphate dikinase [Kosmotogaceae bacterium]|nr:pyruvate, phosphate dikinase [Kosmotogaceae bacterium]
MNKWVYLFKEGNASMKKTLGGKGANLSEMTNIGLPVPPGMTITTEACLEFYKNGKKLTQEIISQLHDNLKVVEKTMGKRFGDSENPLLVSVRSGAAISMPGMMDTILNLGLNDSTVKGMIKATDNPRFCYDSYRRFLQMFGDVVLKIEHELFEEALKEIKKDRGVKLDVELEADDFKKLVEKYKEIYKKAGKEFPQDPWEQLWKSIDAVFGSWMNERAITYRKLNNIDENALMGTAVNVVTMVFGNMGDTSGTGVAFTRDPNTGERTVYGEYLINAQGEDVVAGTRTPEPISKLQEEMPKIYDELIDIFRRLEEHYHDMQDVEFTIERGRLYLLQTRNGKRTPYAAVKIAVDMVKESVMTKEEALLKTSPEHIEILLHPYFTQETKDSAELIAKGNPASPGAATGILVFDSDKADKLVKEENKKVILTRPETSPEDIAGMAASEGILTSTGGKTSHAAVVARGMGKPCIVGCSDIEINRAKGIMKARGKEFKEGSWISIDGTTGEIFEGKLETVMPQGLEGPLAEILSWADEVRRLGVRANADTPKDAETAKRFGAEGIGLARTEHMFFEPDRIPVVRQMILSSSVEQRERALERLLPMQQQDFVGLFKAMEGYPVTIRLLDPPLHEFLPSEEDDIKELAKEMGVSFDKLKEVVESLHEFNPMMGHRGCRLTVTYPEIAVMQTRAIIGAAIQVLKEEGKTVIPEIMIPLVGIRKELSYVKQTIVETADKMIEEEGVDLKYTVGTMIEIPRACLIADEIAKEAEFFSFGTNDLTQLTFGFSRDDYGKFVGDYVAKGILEVDPFQKLDQIGVGQLVRIGTEKGRKTRKDLKVGICGEHGGEPSSVEFCHHVGLDYVSCSPYRVPVARLSAAHAKLKNK